MALAEGLREYGDSWNVLIAENGKKGAEIIDSGNVDLVVTDLRMPVMDGYDLLTYVRHKKPDMPVIVMTADDTCDVKKRLQSLGVKQYINKDFRLPEIAHTISDRMA